MRKHTTMSIPVVMGMFTHPVPQFAEPVAVGWVGGEPRLWLEIRYESEEALDQRSFFCARDGDDIPDDMYYVDSLYSFGGDEMLHVFAEPR